MSYEDQELHYFHNVPVLCTDTESCEMEREIMAWPETLKLAGLQARFLWACRNGTEDRTAELDLQIQHLYIELYDKVKEWATTRIPGGI